MTKEQKILDLYHSYIKEVHNLKDISGYCSKRTITEAVLNPERTNEEKVLDALKGRSFQMGDKVYVYYAEEKTIVAEPRYRKDKKTGEQILVKVVDKEIVNNPLRLKEDFTSDHSVDVLMKKLYNTLIIFKNVIDVSQFPKYHLKSKAVKEKLEEVIK